MRDSLAGTGQLLRLAWRRDRWIIVAAALLMAALAAGSMQATFDLYPSDAEAAAGAEALTANPSFAALYGPLPSATAAGIGVVKTILMGSLFGAFLAFAIVRRHTRTEEEEGRFELVAAGVVGRRAPLVAAVLLAVLAVVASAALSTLGLVAVGADATGSMALGVVILVGGLVMAGVTAVAAQLTSTTRGAGGIALAVLGIAFIVRAAADTATGSGQDLVWLSFLGWAEKASPYGQNRLWVLLPAVAALVVLLVAADVLLHRRDLGAGLWAARPGPARANARLSSPLGLAWRLQRGSLLGWTIGYAVLGLVVGSLAKSVASAADSPAIEDMLRKMSGGGGSIVDVFFGTELRFIAVGAAAYGITTALRLRAEESAGRAEVVLATPVSRWSWLASHAVIATLGSIWLLAVAGLGAGLSAGAASDRGVGDLLPAALATWPAVAVCVALTVLLFGLLPRLSAAAWALLAFFVLVGEFGAILSLPDWALKASPFDHLGTLPGGDANAAGLVGLLVLAVVVAATGAAAFRRRDLTT
ncbi:ABC transporter permease [Knoellia koreensis]|uniref:Polyketide antibiotic transporter n=1 Tax=Knoellia koreensis TaxID=2730921 RepID=A0A849H9S6_9MICO|nr:polyketide antibiotic transporter [Knoellia sp. DB2414S]NNM46486.1 polyketide antibiotic transporter [Knoellia sp. DB2414S]